MQRENDAVSGKKKTSIGVKILLWIFLLPFMIIITIIRNKNMKKSTKAIVITLLCVVSLVYSGTSGNSNNTEDDNRTPSETKNTTSVDNETQNKPEPSQFDIITDENLKADFMESSALIGMDMTKIKDFKQVDDWQGGPRYSFTYANMPFRLYCDMDSTVNTIKLGVDTDIYKKGFEPYQVSDYIVNSGVASELQILSERLIKKQLNFPDTSKFPWLDWSFGREKDLYSASSEVKAENAFGVQDTLPFKLIYQVTKGSANLMYFILDGNVIIDKMDTVSKPERKALPSEDETPNAENHMITLEYGKLGEYGKEITLDGYTSINYHVPTGEYIMKNKVNFCKVYVAKDEYYKNIDGYMENELIEIVEFSSYGEEKAINIPDGTHIELMINSVLELTPKQ